ncbi:MAG TPA: deoxynucleoside kinase [Candidatus Faecivivens stercoripullorum]|uniref:Thymidylate kinase n=1 Tax=Candidatus Faecivivens stercoripullorum TaxID=2840805 RepID=A0A9D1KQE4_9FIRM|nr:deoxynucleoside kinase [Candidatus Faecivivens stercoripullorum]
MGKLIVIDGLDGSGKSTQTDLVAKALAEQGIKVRQISFPDYKEPSSALVKMYLSGVFSENPDDVNAYAAGSFYAVDRYASYKQFWEKDYQDGALILATRYATSNAIHQMGKLPRNQWEDYLHWIEDFEYSKLGLPAPDLVIFLDMNRAVADRLLSERYAGDESKRDIHEKNMAYLQHCRETAEFAGQYWGWKKVCCDDGNAPRPVEEITGQILQLIDEAGL